MNSKGSCVENPIRVFVHLARGYGSREWERRWNDGKIIGINEPQPYGYFRAAESGCLVEYSEDAAESLFGKLFRLGTRSILGFDLVHAWRNFGKIREADVVWTHTESQYLSILLLFRLMPAERRPKIIAQTIWLFDRWKRFGAPRKWFISQLAAQADIITVHSPENLKVAHELFPHNRSELVLFGISAEEKKKPDPRPYGQPLRLISIGNDEHRDWNCLIEAIGGQNQWMLKIASSSIDRRLVRRMTNVEAVKLRSNDELLELYDWADIVVVSLKPNLHASGITVIQEAALRGVPVICSDAGGLRAYFSDREVCFVPAQDKAALRQAIEELAADRERRLALAECAQARMGPAGLSSRAYARRHAEISRELMSETVGACGRDR
jgi:glycosyltransferase involved in cell wall biosynthesis